MGSAEPRSFSRGKRGIAGTLVFTVFDRDALIEALRENKKVQKFRANTVLDQAMTIDQWNESMGVDDLTNQTPVAALTEDVDAFYADEIPPFDITVSFAKPIGVPA